MPPVSPAFSRLGLGITGPHASAAISRDATIDLIGRAAAQGVTLFDTGPAYGGGEGERRLGLALQGLERDDVFICTKAGVHPGKRRDFSPDAISRSLEGSLTRLGTDHVDLLLLHGPGADDLTPALFARLAELRRAGLAHRLGVCGRGPEVEASLAAGVFDAAMLPVWAGMPDEAEARLQAVKEAGLAVIGIEIMAGARKTLLPPRRPSDLWYLARAAKQAVLGPHRTAGALDPEAALAWALDHPAVDAALTLTTRTAHLDANARLAGLSAKA